MSEEELRAVKTFWLRGAKYELTSQELAHACEAEIPRLLAEIDQLRAENEELRSRGADE
jgi:hypothetical protein